MYIYKSNKLVAAILFLFIFSTPIYSQNEKDISKMSKDEILQISNNELIELSLEDLIKIADIVGVSVDELMDLSINSGAKGGFGKQLEDLGLDPYIHGYTSIWYRTNDLNRVKDNKTFSLQYFNPLLGINIKDKIISEIMMEYEHGGNELSIRYGIIDYAFSKYATLRMGKFLMPLGRFNEYLYPEHINKFNDRPISHWNIIPSVYADIGVQLRGQIPFTEGFSVNYAFYMVNGLEQKDQTNYDIRKMRNNFRDYNKDDKSFGGRIAILPTKGAEVGLSYYTGEISSIDSIDLNLSILCFDVEYQYNGFGIRGEYVLADQDTLNGNIKKEGLFVEASYRLNKHFEPALRYEQANIPLRKTFDNMISNEIIQKVSFGLIIYPEPNLISRFNFKINYNYIINDGAATSRNEFIVQACIGF